MALKDIFKKKNDQPQRPRLTGAQNRRAKLAFLFGVSVLLLAGLSIRLMYIVKVHGADYQKAVLQNQQYDTVTIPVRRVDIVDKNGTILATSEKVYNVVIDASVMLTYQNHRYLEPTLEALSQCFSDILNVDAIRYYVTNNESSRYYVVAKRLSYGDIS